MYQRWLCKHCARHKNCFSFLQMRPRHQEISCTCSLWTSQLFSFGVATWYAKWQWLSVLTFYTWNSHMPLFPLLEISGCVVYMCISAKGQARYREWQTIPTASQLYVSGLRLCKAKKMTMIDATHNRKLIFSVYSRFTSGTILLEVLLYAPPSSSMSLTAGWLEPLTNGLS